MPVRHSTIPVAIGRINAKGHHDASREGSGFHRAGDYERFWCAGLHWADHQHIGSIGQLLAANAEAAFIVGALIVVIASAIACIAYGVWEQTAQEHPKRR